MREDPELYIASSNGTSLKRDKVGFSVFSFLFFSTFSSLLPLSSLKLFFLQVSRMVVTASTVQKLLSMISVDGPLSPDKVLSHLISSHLISHSPSSRLRGNKAIPKGR